MIMKIQSNFALLDVKHGRKGLEKALSKGPIPVTITGNLTGVWGNDDGESVEFEVEVTKVWTHA